MSDDALASDYRRDVFVSYASPDAGVANAVASLVRTAPGFQRLKAFTGPPDHERQDVQWQ